MAETRDQNLLFPGTWAKKGVTGLQSSKSEEKATIRAFAQLPAVVQEHLGSSLPFLVPPIDVGRRGPSPSSPVRSQLCKDHFAAPSGTTKAQTPTPAGLCCPHTGAQLHPPQDTQGAALTPLVTLRTLQCPTEGLENTWSQGVHPRAAGHTASAPDHFLQNTSAPKTQLGTERSPEAEVLPPVGRARDAREQESLASLLRLGISPHTTPQRHTSVILYLLQITVPLNGSLLSAQTLKCLKHSRKTQ